MVDFLGSASPLRSFQVLGVKPKLLRNASTKAVVDCIQCGRRPPSKLANGGQKGLVNWGRSLNELGSRMDNAYSCSDSCSCCDGEWWYADAGADEWVPAVGAAGYKGRPRESCGRFALHDGVPGSGRGGSEERRV